MDTYEWLLTLHITAAFFYFGAAVAASILYVLAITAEKPSDAAAYLRLIRRVLPLMFVGVAGTLIFGIWLWHEAGYGIGAGWIWGALVLWVLAAVLGQRGGEHQERARKMAEEHAAAGDLPNAELRAILRDPVGTAMSYGAGAALLAILILMIWKPGQ
ncbi:MAG TPA: DUF2269 family protein [Gaiellaceae bacterium]